MRREGGGRVGVYAKVLILDVVENVRLDIEVGVGIFCIRVVVGSIFYFIGDGL